MYVLGRVGVRVCVGRVGCVVYVLGRVGCVVYVLGRVGFVCVCVGRVWVFTLTEAIAVCMCWEGGMCVRVGEGGMCVCMCLEGVGVHYT